MAIKQNNNMTNRLTIGQKIKLDLVLKQLRPNDTVLDLGCGTMWLTKYLRSKRYNCQGFADAPPADIIGDIRNYKFGKRKFDVVVALEIIEHVECIKQIKNILKTGGILIVSTPVPQLDWLCIIFEYLGIFQKRTSEHINLVNINKLPLRKIYTKNLFFINQFGVFSKK